MTIPKPFQISVPDELLSFIKQRVSTARIPPGLDLPKSEEWTLGIPPATISHLRDYWEKKYDWRSVEAKINLHLKMFTLPIEEDGETMNIHFVHHQSEHPDAVPLIFQHGWPGNFLEVEKIIDLLTSPTEPGQQAYHVVAPSLPGFSFSDGPKHNEFTLKNMASIDHKLMLALGYSKYMAQGGDWGSMVVRIMALDYPESCVAVHVNMVASGPPSWWRNPLSFIYLIFWSMMQKKGKDAPGLGRMMWWSSEEMGYLEIQGTKPQTLAYGLVDSPIGMLAWLREKMQFLIDDDYVWEEEEVITWAMLYIINGTLGHSHIYTNAKGDKLTKLMTQLYGTKISAAIDFGHSQFPLDTLNIPKWWASCTAADNIVYWKEHKKGGHFPATERPMVLVEDIREFTKVVRPTHLAELIKSGKLKV